MFKRPTLIASLMLLLSTLIFLKAFCIPGKKDFQAYLHLATSLASPSSPDLFSSKQTKQNVSKEIWLSSGDKKTHTLFKNNLSVLTLRDVGSKIELIEEMEGNIQCWMEESSLKEKEKQVRYFESERGTYQYNKKLFSAEGAHLFLFRSTAPFASLDLESAFLKGFAQKVYVNMGKEPKFHADQFKAYLKEEL